MTARVDNENIETGATREEARRGRLTTIKALRSATQRDDVRHERTRGGASAIEKGAKGGGGGGRRSRSESPSDSGAIAAYDETLKLNPKDGSAYANKAECYLRARVFEMALENASKAYECAARTRRAS